MGSNPAAARGACALLRQLANADALKAAILAADGLALLQGVVSDHLQSAGMFPFHLPPSHSPLGCRSL